MWKVVVTATNVEKDVSFGFRVDSKEDTPESVLRAAEDAKNQLVSRILDWKDDEEKSVWDS